MTALPRMEATFGVTRWFLLPHTEVGGFITDDERSGAVGESIHPFLQECLQPAIALMDGSGR